MVSSQQVHDEGSDLCRVDASISLVAGDDECAVLAAPLFPRENTVSSVPVEFLFPPATVAEHMQHSAMFPIERQPGFHILDGKVGVLGDAFDGERPFVAVLHAFSGEMVRYDHF